MIYYVPIRGEYVREDDEFGGFSSIMFSGLGRAGGPSVGVAA